MTRRSILSLLARTDKWYLGGGNRLLWAPLFPLWLERPGFWDSAHYYNLEHGPVFTWTLLDEEGRELPLRQVRRSWDPAKLTAEFRVDGGSPSEKRRNAGLRIVEEKCLLPEDVLASSIRIENRSTVRPRKLRLVAWTMRPNAASEKRTWMTDVGFRHDAVTFAAHLASETRPEFSYQCVFGLGSPVLSHAIQLSEGSAIQPHWSLTPFVAKLSGGSLGDATHLGGVNADGLVYMALETPIHVGRGKTGRASVFFAAAPKRAEALSQLRRAQSHADPVAVSEHAWNEYFSSVPYFDCSDPHFNRYYWYRWYGLRLLTTDGGEKNYRHPTVSEGIGYFRAPISYSAVCHMLENRWRHDPALAQGSLLTFIDNQRDDGAFRGYIDPDYYRRDALGEPFYHANWGKALMALQALHPDGAFLRRVYAPLAAYARYFDRERDAEASGLYDIDNHYETGQEYMQRYLAVDPDADRDNWGEVFRLKGVDVSVYLYDLKRALGAAARLLGLSAAESDAWDQGADRTRSAILGSMWDPEAEMFFDVDPRTGVRTGVKAATCFYPYMTDIADDRHLPGLRKHLLNPKEFWTPVPVPSSSLDDPMFSAEAQWKGKRMNCPWNGRVWPMTNSHIAEALARSARTSGDAELTRAAATFLRKFVRMLFDGGDPERPNAFEHYHPSTGEPSRYRGVDDYQHSWVNDLIIRYAAGLEVVPGRIELAPLPLGLTSLTLDQAFVGGRMVRLRMHSGIWTLWIDKKKCFEGKVRGRVVIPL